MPDTQTINTLPSQNATFITDLQTFLAEEDADRFNEIMTPFVVSGGTHGTGGSLVGNPGTTIAYPAGFRTQETATITYPDNTANIWVVIHKDQVTAPGGNWIRVAGTNYLYDPVSASQPTAPTGSLILMRVVTSGGSITTATDLRNTNAFTNQTGVIKVSSDDTTPGYLDGKLVAGTNITLTVGSAGSNETLTVAASSLQSVTSNDTTPGVLNDKLTTGDGITKTEVNDGGNESLDLDIDLDTNSGLEFNSAKLRAKVATDGGVERTANGIEVVINNVTELTSGLDTPDDEVLIHDAGAAQNKSIKLSMLVPTGMVIPYVGTTAPDNWLLCQGGTIGNASSGGTSRANADTEELFTLLWDSMADGQAPVSSGRGASAAADFAADKTITLPDMRQNVPVGKDAGTFGTLGDTGGSETHTLVVGEMPAHSHTYSNSLGGSSAGGGGTNSNLTPAAASETIGGGGAHNNLQPWISLNYIIKL